MGKNEHEINLFISDCIRLESFIRMYCSTYSPREVMAVMTRMIKEYVGAEEDPKAAMDQILDYLKLPTEKCDESE